MLIDGIYESIATIVLASVRFVYSQKAQSNVRTFNRMAKSLQMPPFQFMDAATYIEEHSSVELDQRTIELKKAKDQIQAENHRLSQIYLSLERRNNTIIEELQIQQAEQQKRLEEHVALFHKSQKECQEEIYRVQVEVQQDYQKAEAVLITHKKERNHLRFNLQEKKEVDETRIAMLAQRDRLTQELKDVTKECRHKAEQFEREQYAERERQQEAQGLKLKQDIAEAKAVIDKEKLDTLKEAESESKVLAIEVTKSQKVVVALRDEYNKLLEEENELEMQLMESKLVTQLTKPEANQETIGRLQEEKGRIEEQKIRARTKPESENRRKATQHSNAMKKKQNELSGFLKLNQLKHDEMEQLRALALNVIEQRNALIMFLNETMTTLRHEIASSYDQKGQPFRTSELILCHLADGDDEVLGRHFQPNDASTRMTAVDQLKLLEVLYARFSGVRAPRKMEAVI
jgi:hypothetical protein